MIIAGTGHRPTSCPCKYDEKHPWLINLRSSLSNTLKELKPEIEAVIGGCAIGWDTWLVQEALKLDIPVWSYVPFHGQGSTWPKASQDELARILNESAKVEYVSDSYSKDAFLKRDRAMIGDCTDVFALWNPEHKYGGTYYTVQYAQSLDKCITNFWRD